MDYSGRFRSTNDASMRHRSTYIGIKKPDGLIEPFLIQDVTGEADDPRLHLVTVGSASSSLTRNMSDLDVLMERPEIGMANLICHSTRKTCAVWYEAAARRQIKRSLDFSLLESKVIGDTEISSFFRVSVDTTSAPNRRKTLDAFYNDRYPRFTECIQRITEGRHVSMAFAKRFALCSHAKCGIVIYYKNIVVGYIEDNEAILLPQFNYLSESLEESSYAFE